ncbi:adenine phosphoribosyltransferase [Cellulomonas sp. H30R-01]|uniref:phosphoribosyltransferase family protein n=1 Tax=Cellulomonas sp. H30R-01 TaxID=2704467 RepID=UPI00138C29D3|nr:phosphoribosyltransferase family protein [Cellulomonas sp. H30R-01]QHT56962.1 adenine phosphoribosyltransferase [Cellulomonas sp. H30R-01]
MTTSALRATFRWRGDRTDPTSYADVSGWWRDPAVLAALGPALAALAGAPVTAVVGPPSRGSMLGVLTALHLGAGFVELRKDAVPSADSDAWWQVTTRPDYRDRHLTLGVRRGLLRSGDRVLFVDDWIDTGAQALACRELVRLSGATWVGAAVVVDGCAEPSLRRALGLRSLLHLRDL